MSSIETMASAVERKLHGLMETTTTDEDLSLEMAVNTLVIESANRIRDELVESIMTEELYDQVRFCLQNGLTTDEIYQRALRAVSESRAVGEIEEMVW